MSKESIDYLVDEIARLSTMIDTRDRAGTPCLTDQIIQLARRIQNNRNLAFAGNQNRNHYE